MNSKRLAGGFLLACLLAACVHEPGSVTGHNRDVSGEWRVQEIAAGGAFTPAIAMDRRRGVIYVVYASPRLSGGYDVYLRRGLPDRPELSAPVRVNGEGDAAHPIHSAPIRMTVGPEGNVYLVWRQENMAPEVLKAYPWGLTRLLFVRSTDGGQTFSDPIEVAAGFPHAKDFPSLAVNQNGQIILAWLTYGPGIIESDVHMSASVDHGRSFSPPAVVDRVVCGCCGPAVATSRSSETFVAWRDIDRAPGAPETADIRDIKFRSTRNDGVTFTEALPVPVNGWNVATCTHTATSLAVDRHDRLHVAYYSGRPDFQGTHYALFEKEAGRYLKRISLTTGDFVPPSKVSLALDDRDRAWVAWEDRSDHGYYTLETKGIIDASSALIRVGRIDADGLELVETSEVGAGIMPQVASSGSNAYLVWSHNGRVFLGRR